MSISGGVHDVRIKLPVWEAFFIIHYSLFIIH